MSIAQLVLGVDAPPVGVIQVDNRVVLEGRCKEFATYVDNNPRWGSPSLMLWAPEGTVRFEPLDDVNRMIPPGIQVGILYVPRNSRLSIRILDGQHRIKGLHLWVERKNAELSKAKEHLARAREVGEQSVIDEAKAKVHAAEQALARTEKEHIGVDFIEVNSPKEAKQIFADIANHAKGMTKALTTGFDASKVVNRVTTEIGLENPIPVLADRVDFNKDRLSGSNPNLLSAKTVADIVRTTYVGILGRVSKAQERNTDDKRVAHNATQFFEALTEAFPELLSTPAPQLRETSLIASGTILRVLAGAWHSVRTTVDHTGANVTPRMSNQEFVAFLKKLAPHMSAPVLQGNPWLSTGYFPPVPDGSAGVMAPSSRTQDLRGLSELMTNWALGIEKMPF